MALLWPYGAKDCVDIGHGAIAMSNAARVLPTTGQQHAEPILRRIVQRIISVGDSTYWPNRDRVRQSLGKLPPRWAANTRNEGFTREMFLLLRQLRTDDACRLSVDSLAAGTVAAGAIELVACVT